MPVILTDCPERLEAFLGESADCRQVDLASLSAARRHLWSALADGAPVWQATLDHAPAHDRWSTLLFVEDASRSQMDALQESLRLGGDLGGAVVCLAFTGSGFHGQRGRAWAAPEGNLYLSAAMPVRAPVERVVPALTMLPAVATVEAIERLAGGPVRPRIKWVNDVLIDERKVAGVLTATLTKGREVETAVFGIGVNVACTPDIPPTPFVPRAGCLCDACASSVQAPTLAELYWQLLDALAAGLAQLLREGPNALRASYQEHSMVVGRRVAIYDEETEGSTDAALGPPLAEGVVKAINPDLSLTLAGHAEPVTRGRLALVKE